MPSVHDVAPQRVKLPTWRGSRAPFGREFRLDLADINADSIRAIVYDGQVYIYFRTRDGVPAIKRRLDFMEDAEMKSSTYINLSNSKAASGIAAAFTQVVKLCQSAP